jgi:hypothetical protein
MTVRNRVEILSYVDIEYPAQSLLYHSGVERVYRLMGRAARPEAIRAGQKVLLINCKSMYLI